jgi:hypothetical protein
MKSDEIMPRLPSLLTSPVLENFVGAPFEGDPYERIHVLEDMLNDLTSRWRRSTTLALNSISALEEELAKRLETISSLNRQVCQVSRFLQYVPLEIYYLLCSFLP